MITSAVDECFDPESRMAKAAREWFAKNGPSDLQPLPLGYDEREHLKHGGADHILAWYARSLACCDYDFLKHPNFHDYACGVIASEHAPYFITNNDELQKRFPPRPLAGLDNGFFWTAPKKKRGRPRKNTQVHAVQAPVPN
jgi:hypothetical protein